MLSLLMAIGCGPSELSLARTACDLDGAEPLAADQLGDFPGRSCGEALLGTIGVSAAAAEEADLEGDHRSGISQLAVGLYELLAGDFGTVDGLRADDAAPLILVELVADAPAASRLGDVLFESLANTVSGVAQPDLDWLITYDRTGDHLFVPEWLSNMSPGVRATQLTHVRLHRDPDLIHQDCSESEFVSEGPDAAWGGPLSAEAWMLTQLAGGSTEAAGWPVLRDEVMARLVSLCDPSTIPDSFRQKLKLTVAEPSP